MGVCLRSDDRRVAKMSERMEFNHGNKFDFQSSQALLNEPALGTPGLVPAPAMGTQWPSVIQAPVGVRSGKPEKFRHAALCRHGAGRPAWLAPRQLSISLGLCLRQVGNCLRHSVEKIGHGAASYSERW